MASGSQPSEATPAAAPDQPAPETAPIAQETSKKRRAGPTAGEIEAGWEAYLEQRWDHPLFRAYNEPGEWPAKPFWLNRPYDERIEVDGQILIKPGAIPRPVPHRSAGGGMPVPKWLKESEEETSPTARRCADMLHDLFYLLSHGGRFGEAAFGCEQPVSLAQALSELHSIRRDMLKLSDK